MDARKYGADRMMLLPPKPGTCPVCATEHDPALPHNRCSLYYQMRYYRKHGRFPTWADAMAHCSDEMKAYWTNALTEKGVPKEELEEHGQPRMDSV